MDRFTALFIAIVLLSTCSVSTLLPNSESFQRFLIKPKDKVTDLKTNVSFPCQASGNPIIFWEKVGRREFLMQGVQGPRRLNAEVDDQGTLHIQNAGYSERGTYNCIAVYPTHAIHTSLDLRVVDMRRPIEAPSNVSVFRIPGKYIIAKWLPPPMKYRKINITSYTVTLRRGTVSHNYDTVNDFTTSGQSLAMFDSDVRATYWILVTASTKFGSGPSSEPVKPKMINMTTDIFETSGWRKSGPKVTIIEESPKVKVNVTWPPIKRFYHSFLRDYSVEMTANDGTFHQATTRTESVIMANIQRGRTYTFRVRPRTLNQRYGPWTPYTELAVPAED